MSAFITMMMEAASTSETLVNLYQTTRRNNPKDSHLHTHCCENLNSHFWGMLSEIYLQLLHFVLFKLLCISLDPLTFSTHFVIVSQFLSLKIGFLITCINITRYYLKCIT
jgi:hypothetical protein